MATLIITVITWVLAFGFLVAILKVLWDRLFGPKPYVNEPKPIDLKEKK